MYRRSLIKAEERTRQRAEFAVRLSRLMSSGRKLYFFDESRVDSWSTKARSWSAKYTNSFVPLNSPMHSLTIYAAVGTGQPVLFFTKGCNSDNLMEFIPILKAGIVSTRSKVKPILVID